MKDVSERRSQFDNLEKFIMGPREARLKELPKLMRIPSEARLKEWKPFTYPDPYQHSTLELLL